MTRALICGVSGQDGAWLARLLLDKGYDVIGTSRDAEGNRFTNLQRLGILDRVARLSMVPEDFRSVLVAIDRVEPDEVYFLAGQSSVALSFEQPSETMNSIVLGTLNLLEACRLSHPSARLYHAGSSEVFGDCTHAPAREDTPFNPRSPYAIAKASAAWLVHNYREAYGLFACTGFLFNHESVLRPERFVTQKIVRAVHRIAAGSPETLQLGRLDVVRDWGWAPEYVEAMWMMLQRTEPDDYIVATGHSCSLESFVADAFASVGLVWRDHVAIDDQMIRPSDIMISAGDPSKAATELGWRARTRMPELIAKMIIEP
ncbi:GDP-mannose 4,6-dehydratase [Sphingomonas sp. BT-65]|uniref:GDP-mannose 4,6-dehydratase n=1 Tax=Sphingomonas sp. BT-65 TaxID=2989821 RepID=UPI002236B49A|nr:GDP-mannose 4,6-dehydratase [Sphingomonas sp. BT-65]MCW4461895.1 GDP-mannose 4,6-dehydratase [Sphingomonas sp. BT-65]